MLRFVVPTFDRMFREMGAELPEVTQFVVSASRFVVDYGLYGYAMSRFAGSWAAMKCVKDNIESTASVDASLARLRIVTPEFEMPPGGLGIRNELDQLGQEERLHEHKRAAMSAFIAAWPIRPCLFISSISFLT